MIIHFLVLYAIRKYYYSFFKFLYELSNIINEFVFLL